MKILIPLTILVVSFIIYYFFNRPISTTNSEAIPVNTEILPLEKEKQVAREASREVVQDDYLSNLATIQTSPITSKKADHVEKEMPREYLTLDDLKSGKFQKGNRLTTEETSQQSYDQMIFEQLKLILQQASSTYYSRRNIVLNSHISSILMSQNAREKFKVSLSTDFGLDDYTIEEQMKKNRTVWDWVIFLTP